MTITRTHAASAIAAVSIATLIANAGLPTHNWLNPASGSWSVSTNWDVGTVPDFSSEVHIGLFAPYIVSSGGSIEAGALTITNVDAQLHISNANTFDLYGNLNNQGLIIVNPTGNISATQIDFEADCNITGNGELRLASSGARARLRSGATFTVTNGGTHSITGFGQIEAAIDNIGTIEANVPAQQLMLMNRDKSNSGFIRAADAGTLNISAITLSQFGAGIVEAVGTDSVVQLNSPTIMHGRLRTDSDGLISINTATLDNTNLIGGNMHVENANTLNVFNSIVNEGTITVNPTGNISATQIVFRTSGEFDGTGEVVLNSLGPRARLQTDMGMTMTNTVDHTIRGFGQIEAEFINDGLVQADVPGSELLMLSQDKTNNVTMEAVGGGVLDFSNITVANTMGELVADGVGSRIDLNGTSVIGGDLLAINGATVDLLSASLTGVHTEGLLNLRNSHTLTVTDSILNNAMIVVNSDASISATQINFANDGAFMGTGSVKLNSNSSRARIQSGPGVTVTNQSTHTIFGRGQIEASLVNNGLIRSDEPGNEMLFTSNGKVNNATIRAENTGAIDFANITVENTLGELVADGVDSRIDLNATSVIGGDLLALNGAHTDVFTASLTGVRVEGLLNLRNGYTLTVTDSITNDGMIVVNSDGSISATQITFANDGAFMGSGSVKLNSLNTRARIQSAPGVTVTNPSTHTIFGYGRVEALLINNGLIRSDEPGNEMLLSNNNKVNNATIRAENTAAIDIAGITIEQGPSGVLIADGVDTRIDLNGTAVIGGAINAINGGRVDVNTATLDAVMCDAPINVFNAQTLRIQGGVINNSLITVNSQASISSTQLTWLDDSELGGNGTVRLNNTLSRARLLIGGDATTATLGSGQRLEGIGRIDAPLIQNGTTAPGMSIGTMSASQPLTLTETSVFEAEVNADSADLLDSTSTIDLGGTLQVVYTDAFAPTGFWSRKIMEGSDITDKFDAISVPAPAAGLVTRVYNTGTELFVGQTCPSDTNLDGALNFFDVSVFLSNYNAGNLDADLNGDGVLNFFDVSTFLSSYNTGC